MIKGVRAIAVLGLGSVVATGASTTAEAKATRDRGACPKYRTVASSSDSKKAYVGLHAKLEWLLATEEIDMYMFDGYGSMAAWSEACNQLPAKATEDAGGPRFECMPGYPAINCSGFTIESNAMWTTAQTATLNLWLGSVEWQN